MYLSLSFFADFLKPALGCLNLVNQDLFIVVVI